MPHTAAMPPIIATLHAEHVHLTRISALMSEQLDAIDRGAKVDSHVLYEIMSYMVDWADRHHHPREDLIYGRAAELDSQLADDVDSLQRQHDAMAKTALALLKLISRWRAGDVSGGAVVSAGRDYVANSERHRHSEEQLVFPRIKAVLTAADWRELELDDRLQAAGDPVLGPQVGREFRNLARKLRRSTGRRLERGVVTEWAGLESIMESLEVLSNANRMALSATGDTLRSAVQESLDIVRKTPVTAGPRCVLNNARLGGRWLGTLATITIDTLIDLARIRRESANSWKHWQHFNRLPVLLISLRHNRLHVVRRSFRRHHTITSGILGAIERCICDGKERRGRHSLHILYHANAAADCKPGKSIRKAQCSNLLA